MKDAIDVIIQARLDSTRLPRKVMLPILDKPMIAHLVERLQLSETVRQIVVATTEDSFGPIRHALSDYPDVKFFVGSEADVLERYYLASKMYGSRIVVRATADNPLTCPEFLDRAVELHLDASGDLTHYLAIPLGSGVEVISQEALTIAYRSATEKHQREHVTPYIYRNRPFFRVLEPLATGYYHAPDVKITVDTPCDFERVKGVFEFYRKKTFIKLEDVIEYFHEHDPGEYLNAAV